MTATAYKSPNVFYLDDRVITPYGRGRIAKFGNDLVWVALDSNKHRPGHLTPFSYGALKRV